MFERCVKVEFCDIDENNKATNKGLLRLMQEVSGYHSEFAGYGINDMCKTNYLWILINQRMRVFSRPQWSTELNIKTWSRGAKGMYCLRDFEVWDGNNNMVCIASTSWVIINYKTGSIVRPTEDLLKAYQTNKISVFNGCIKRIREPDNSEKTFEYKIQKRDIDINHHVNNLFYLDFAQEALPRNLHKDFNYVEVFYKKEALLYGSIICFYSFACNEHIITIKDKESDTIHSIVKFSNDLC